MSEITVTDLRFGFRNETVLENINFRCDTGAFVAFLGASGCGKSTLLRLVANLLVPTAGQVARSHQAAGARDVGFVFQKPTLCPWRSVLGNIQLPLQLSGVPRAARHSRAQQARELVGLLPSDEAKLPQQLSGGMQMRVSLARALVTKPQIMLMDEPFSALDEVLRQQLCETVLTLWEQEAWTTIFVTHNVLEASFMSQRIYILAGRPATIVRSIDVPFERRDAALLTSLEFLRFVSEASRCLRDAVESAQGSPVGLEP